MASESVNIMGSTGSIGVQALEVAKLHKIRVNGISANKNVELMEKQIREFSPKICHMYDEKAGKELKLKVADTDTKVIWGADSLSEFAVWEGADTLINSVMGSIGLKSTVTAIEKGLKIALANKETLVAAGKIVTEALKKHNGTLIPVDSEHSAIFQSLMGNDRKALKNIILTASGGPFFGKKREELEKVTVADALNHPNWSMGAKITVDSATMMNKGLEVIEAKWLFGTENIKVVIHRESIIHSMVEYIDNSVIAQLGVPSMKIPIQFALTYPERYISDVPSADFPLIGNLSFYEPDYETFGCLKIAIKAMKQGGLAPLCMNAANEVAVEYFLKGKIKFTQIEETVANMLSGFENSYEYTLEECLEKDKEIRAKTYEYLGKEL